MNKIPSYEEVAIGNFWKSCKTCEFGNVCAINGKLYCRRGSFPKKLRRDRQVNPDGFCSYHRDADVPF